MFTTPTTTRAPFPVDQFATSSTCPACGSFETIQFIDKPVRFWGNAEVTNGVLSFDGTWDVTDDGDDEHIECWQCGTEWDTPEEMDFR